MIPSFTLPQLSSNPLSVENAGECLSMLCKTGDGLAHAYANMDVKDRFVRLRYHIFRCFMQAFHPLKAPDGYISC